MSEPKPVSGKRTAKKAAPAAKPVAGKKAATTKPKVTVGAKPAGEATVAPAAATVKPAGKAPAAAAPKAKAAVARAPAAPKSAVTAAPAATSASGKPGSAGKGAPAIKPVDKPPAPSHAERRRWIATAAYLRAEQRGFAPGYELQDWLEAEAEIEHLIGKGT